MTGPVRWLALWLHYFGLQQLILKQHPHRIHCVKYESLVRDPVSQLRKVLDFLELGYEDQVAHGSGNTDGVPSSELSYKWRAIEPITNERIDNWRRELSMKQIARLENWGGEASKIVGLYIDR